MTAIGILLLGIIVALTAIVIGAMTDMTIALVGIFALAGATLYALVIADYGGR